MPLHFLQMNENDDGSLIKPMGVKKGIKEFGDKVIQALMKEFIRFEDLDVYKGIMTNTLTSEQKKKALRAISIIKMKRSGIIKGRTVGDGRIQRDLYSKEETSSPTPSNGTFMMSLLIGALEQRVVGCGDIPGAYLQAKMKDFTVIKYTGESVNILCKVNPKYKKYVTIENSKRVIYIRLLKVLYGCVQSGLLWYELFWEC